MLNLNKKAVKKLDDRVGRAGCSAGIRIAEEALAIHPDDPEVMRIYLYAAKYALMCARDVPEEEKKALRQEMPTVLIRYLSNVKRGYTRDIYEADFRIGLGEYERAAEIHLGLCNDEEARDVPKLQAIHRAEAAECYAAAQSYEKAIELIDEALAVVPERPDYLAFKGHCLELRGDTESAMKVRLKAANILAEFGREMAAETANNPKAPAVFRHPKSVDEIMKQLSERDDDWPFD